MTVFPPLSPSLSTAQADPSSTPTSDAVDETSADAVAVADFDPRTHPGIKDSLEQLAWVLDTRAHRWYGTDKRLCGETAALLTWARALSSDDRASASDLRNLHLSIELLPQALREGRAPVNPRARLLGVFARAAQAVSGIHQDLRLLRSSSNAGVTRHNAEPPTEEHLRERLIAVDQELFHLELATSKLASGGCDADRAWALELRNGELRELRAIYSAATGYRSNASGRWKADAAIQKVQARMTDLHLLFGHPPPSRPPP